mmetsp:Transcript_7428/g.21097  ORF Transcript_7428/g.21097 Transcript_7428/m.21097 type:complete len:383 (+) Transcript_7428:405-1553(+)
MAKGVLQSTKSGLEASSRTVCRWGQQLEQSARPANATAEAEAAGAGRCARSLAPLLDADAACAAPAFCGRRGVRSVERPGCSGASSSCDIHGGVGNASSRCTKAMPWRASEKPGMCLSSIPSKPTTRTSSRLAASGSQTRRIAPGKQTVGKFVWTAPPALVAAAHQPFAPTKVASSRKTINSSKLATSDAAAAPLASAINEERRKAVLTAGRSPSRSMTSAAVLAAALLYLGSTWPCNKAAMAFCGKVHTLTTPCSLSTSTSTSSSGSVQSPGAPPSPEGGAAKRQRSNTPLGRAVGELQPTRRLWRSAYCVPSIPSKYTCTSCLLNCPTTREVSLVACVVFTFCITPPGRRCFNKATFACMASLAGKKKDWQFPSPDNGSA